MFDGVVQDQDGKLIDASDAPNELFFVPGSSPDLTKPQRAQWWWVEACILLVLTAAEIRHRKYDQVANFSDRSLPPVMSCECFFLKDDLCVLLILLLGLSYLSRTADRC